MSFFQIEQISIPLTWINSENDCKTQHNDCERGTNHNQNLWFENQNKKSNVIRNGLQIVLKSSNLYSDHSC